MKIDKNNKPFSTYPGLMEKLNELGEKKRFEKGEVIVSEQAPIRSIPIVMEGSLKVMQSDDDYREMLLYYLQPGETCIMSFLGGLFHEPSKVKAIARETTEVLFIPTDKVRTLISDYPEWLNYIFHIYHRRFQELLDVVNATAFKKMDERLLQLLRRKTEITGSKNLQLTHEELANELGTARVVVSRLLKQMEKEGLVKLGRNKITLT